MRSDTLRKVALHLGVIIAIGFASTHALADVASDFVSIRCLSSLDRVSVGSFTMWDVCENGRCVNDSPLPTQGTYEAQIFLERFEQAPFSCVFSDGRTASVRIVDHGEKQQGDPWLTLEFKVDELVVGHESTRNGNFDAQMDGLPSPKSVAFTACDTPEMAFQELPPTIKCIRSWTDQKGHPIVEGRHDSLEYLPSPAEHLPNAQ
jgi:hypothetical protein